MGPEEELEDLRCALQQISADRVQKQLELAGLSVGMLKLRRRIAEMTTALGRDDGDSSDFGEESEWETARQSFPKKRPVHPWTPGRSRAPSLLPDPGSMRHLVSDQVLWPSESIGPPLGSLVTLPKESPPCCYACFLAGPELVGTMLCDLATLGCHWLRSLEVTRLSSQTLASHAERERLRGEYSPSTADIRPVVNFIVWRRSMILLLSLANLGAFGFSLFGDNWATLRHMRNMHEVSQFKVSFESWREDFIASLPLVSCMTIDAHFGDILSEQSARHEVVAGTCRDLLEAGVQCADPLSEAISGCWRPGFCSETVAERCPLACSGQQNCRDTRDMGALTFDKFATAFGKAMVYMLMEELCKAELLKQLFLTATKLATSVLLLKAAAQWADWSRSHRFVLLAWLVTFCAPFVRSVVPSPVLINWEPVDQQLKEFLMATNQHYNISSRMGNLEHVAGISCKDHAMEDKLDSTWSQIHHDTTWWCGKVNSAAWWFPWSTTLKRAVENCQVITKQIGIGDDATHVVGTDKEELCRMINHTKVEDVKENPLGSIREILDVPWVRNAAKGLLGMMSSVLSFRALVPLALSIAPGLLTAAIRIKVMIPESYLPGVFIVIMPLLYVPLIWSFSMFVVQGFGDPCLLAGIALLAFSPLGYTLLAVSMRVTSPMSRRGAQVFAERAWWCVAIMRVVALLCIAAYVTKVGIRFHEIEASRKGLVAFLIEQGKELLLPLLIGHVDSLISLALSGPLWSFVFSCVVQLYLTTIVASDWLLRASAEEWDSHGEECLVELQESGQLDDKRELEMLHRKREAAMMAMLELTAAKRRSDLSRQ